MGLELIAAIAAGIALAGLALVLRQLSGWRLPRWIVPASAGLGLLGFTVWNEYNWFPRVVAAFPDPLVVAWKDEQSAPWRPWSYIWPLTTQAVVLDPRSARRHPAQPAQVMVDMVLVERWAPGRPLTAIFDCAAFRRADVTGGGVTFGEDGQIAAARWLPLPADDPIMRTACDGG